MESFSVSEFSTLIIEPTEDTPAVNFDIHNNHLELNGYSVPEDGFAFYYPLLAWVDNYLLTLPKRIEVKIRLDYFNTTSSKFILDLLKRLEEYKTEEIEVKINWYFQIGDEDLEEAGLNYSEIVKIPFVLIPY